MHFMTVTIFPDLFERFWEYGILRRAIESGILQTTAIDIRRFATDRHATTDDRPFGGGCGMVMKPEPLTAAIRWARNQQNRSRCILLSPQGRMLTQKLARSLSHEPSLILVCGRYEGVDERVVHREIDEEISIGDYVLTGGELAAMVVMETVVRFLPGALGNEDSATYDSFEDQLLDHAHYTRPSVFEGEGVPEVLLSGHHERIARWRLESSLIRTFLKRPDLLAHRSFSKQEIEILTSWRDQLDTLIHRADISGVDPLPGQEP
ncbi:MAG: tRNA (guanosine(37)-N1)-methyltransferase TrmD [Thermodesulfobacteriota bacterium]